MVVMVSVRTPWIGCMLSRLERGPEDENAFPWCRSLFYQMFEQAMAALGCDMVPCKGRHGGISTDMAHRDRSLGECMKRWRWGAAKSVARCRKADRLSDACASCRPRSRPASSTAGASSRSA
eukprot:1534772-Pyramimonas_sp.AAC.1